MADVRDPIYLDHNATTPVRPEVVEAMLPYLREHFGNPSSAHVYGERAAAAVAGARQQVASFVGAEPDEIVFTSCGTESNNLAICGAAKAAGAAGHLVTSEIEHPATRRPARTLECAGWRVTRLGVDGHGRIDLDAARAALADGATLVSVMHANNEVGTLQPVAEIAAAARDCATDGPGAVVHTDAAQSLGKVGVDVNKLGVDLLSLAGHKLGAPKGIGALYVRSGTRLEPVLCGSGHEGGLRPGTENVPYIVGLGVACELAGAELARTGEQLKLLRDRLWDRLAARIEGLRLHGHPDLRLPNTLNVGFPGVWGHDVLDHAADRVAASTGSACHEGAASPSAVLLAMGLAPLDAMGAVRLSLGHGTTGEQVDHAADALVAAWEECRK